MEQSRILLHRHPRGRPVAGDFRISRGPVPAPGRGELLCRNRILSLDPYLRGVISGRQIYAEKLAPGDVMAGTAAAEVTESRHPRFSRGDLVVIPGGWQEWAVVDGSRARRVDERYGPLSTALGVLGMPGLTGWAGMLCLAAPKAGETVVVSAASGAVGSTAGQLARHLGCRVVGIAGGAQKCAFVREELAFDACIDHRGEDLREALQRTCPDRVHCYLDNVGGATLAAVLDHLALGARVTLCGLISQYNEETPPPGPNLGPVIAARATVKGLVVYDFYDRFGEFLEAVGPLVRDGRLKYREDWSEGLSQAPEAFARLMRGENFGKTLVRISG